jgi:hypothetical protein
MTIPGLNPGRHGGKRATNRLSYGAAFSRPVTGIALHFTLQKKYAYEITLQNRVVCRTKPAGRSVNGCGVEDKIKEMCPFIRSNVE